MGIFYVAFLLGGAVRGCCLRGDTWKLFSEHVSSRSYKTQDPGNKLWSIATQFGRLSCAALCFQKRDCVFFHHQNHMCYGYDSTGGRAPVTVGPTVSQGKFKRCGKRAVPALPKGYVQLGSSGRYAKRHYQNKTWDDALEACQAEGGTLIKVDQQVKQAYDEIFYKLKQKVTLWIGLTDKYRNDTWFWTDGTLFGETKNWWTGEPNNLYYDGTEENCGTTGRCLMQVKMLDYPCRNLYNFVCERSS